jgi:hypothetical protein
MISLKGGFTAMENFRRWIAVIGVLLLTLISASALAKKPLTDQEMVIWALTKTEVVDPGKTTQMDEGVFIQGYTLEAKARSKGGNVVPEGTFHLTMDAFSPESDMPGQLTGFWYVQGHWTITKKNADPNTLKVKHNPDKAEGILVAEVPFNPTMGAGNWTGRAVMQMALAAGRWSRGEGTLTFGENLEGDLFLPLERWPEVE